MLLIVLPSLLAAWLFAFGFFALGPKLVEYGLLDWIRWATLAYTLPLDIRLGAGAFHACFHSELKQSDQLRDLSMLFWAILAGAVGGLLLYGIAKLTLALTTSIETGLIKRPAPGGSRDLALP